MKQKRMIGIGMVILIFLSLIFSGSAQAATGSLWVKPESRRDSGYQYMALGMPVWKFKETNSSGSVATQTRTLYCLRGGPGFAKTDDMGNSMSGLSYREFTQKFDMNQPSSITTAYQAAIPAINSEQYKQLMWILNEIYVPSKNSADEEKAEIYKNTLLADAGIDVEYCHLTDDDIDVVQQLAVWYFANNINTAYKNENFTLATNPVRNTYIDSLRDFVAISDQGNIGEWRQEDAEKLFAYFVTSAVNKGKDYVYHTGANQAPFTLDKSKVGVETVGNNYIVGPYRFNKVRDVRYQINDVQITTNKGAVNEDNVGFVEKSGTNYNDVTDKYLQDYIASGDAFYLKMPVGTDVNQITFAYSANYVDTAITYWSIAEGDTRYHSLSQEQPIVEIERNYVDFEDEVTAPVGEPKELDLSLRKYITKLNGEVVTDRIPNVVTSNLNRTEDTAKYNHKKDDKLTKKDEFVEYTITVYNEGTKDAYAPEIKDYLPAGIEFDSLVSDTTKYSANAVKNADGTSVVTITNNGRRVLKAFDRTKTSTLDSESVVIRCKITADVPKTQKLRLVNIAEISKYYDAEENKEVNTDRDSQPNNFPDGNKNDPTYVGRTPEGEYVPGQQDDDDFEPLVVKGDIFDLALRKFIIQVGSVKYTGDGGTYLREPIPVITNLRPNGTKQETAVYNHTKKPVPVKVGDEVIYMLRVYNEGEVDGYANEIKDYLPECLEFLPLDSFNTARGWTYYKDPMTGRPNKRIVVTNYLSEERDAEENLIQAFDGTHLQYKEVAIKCKVVKVENMPNKITNIAEITDDSDDDDDSTTNNQNLPTDDKLPEYKDDQINNPYIPGDDGEDDNDFEKLILQEFDLALRKFITKIGDKDITSRNPVFKIVDGKYIYEHDKTPLEVDTGDVVIYTIRVYNEGNIAGYASEITDDIPKGLQFLPDHEINNETGYDWKMIDGEGNVTEDSTKAVKIVTDYLSKGKEKVKGQYLLDAFDPETMQEPAHKEVKVAFKVIAANSTQGIITNYAQITEDTDEDGNPIEDKDSDTEEWRDGDDDQDVEHIKLTRFDLALRKFISKVNDKDITDRVPVFSITEGKYVYNHTKEPIDVENGNTIIYTIRVYNEGTKAGYAKEITDDIPDGLEFLPNHEINNASGYNWKMIDKDGNVTQEVSKAVKITTNYLSKENEKTPLEFLLKPFDSKTMEEPDHKEVKVAFKVVEPNTSSRIIINRAQITDDSDKDGNPVIDEDSIPEEWREGDDDQDIEKIKVKYFDLSLKKWVTQAIIVDNGKETVINSGHTGDENPEPPIKVEIVAKRINKVVVKFRYKIKITNEGEIAGYATEISDYIPAGLRFDAADNPKWQEVDGKVVTDQLKDTLLQPGESAEVEILLTWINGKDNFGEKVNTAEISKDKNDSNTPDIDSTPNNRVPKEDDIDIAPVVLSVKTGENGNTITYIATGMGVFALLITGVVLIKKYVLI